VIFRNYSGTVWGHTPYGVRSCNHTFAIIGMAVEWPRSQSNSEPAIKKGGVITRRDPNPTPYFLASYMIYFSSSWKRLDGLKRWPSGLPKREETAVIGDQMQTLIMKDGRPSLKAVTLIIVFLVSGYIATHFKNAIGYREKHSDLETIIQVMS